MKYPVIGISSQEKPFGESMGSTPSKRRERSIRQRRDSTTSETIQMVDVGIHKTGIVVRPGILKATVHMYAQYFSSFQLYKREREKLRKRYRSRFLQTDENISKIYSVAREFTVEGMQNAKAAALESEALSKILVRLLIEQTSLSFVHMHKSGTKMSQTARHHRDRNSTRRASLSRDQSRESFSSDNT